MNISNLTITEKLALAENERTDSDTLVKLAIDNNDSVAMAAAETLDTIDDASFDNAGYFAGSMATYAA